MIVGCPLNFSCSTILITQDALWMLKPSNADIKNNLHNLDQSLPPIWNRSDILFLPVMHMKHRRYEIHNRKLQIVCRSICWEENQHKAAHILRKDKYFILLQCNDFK